MENKIKLPKKIWKIKRLDEAKQSKAKKRKAKKRKAEKWKIERQSVGGWWCIRIVSTFYVLNPIALPCRNTPPISLSLSNSPSFSKSFPLFLLSMEAWHPSQFFCQTLSQLINAWAPNKESDVSDNHISNG